MIHLCNLANGAFCKLRKSAAVPCEGFALSEPFEISVGAGLSQIYAIH